MTKAGADWEVISYSGTKRSLLIPMLPAPKYGCTRLQQANRPGSWKAIVTHSFTIEQIETIRI
jgi:hypothetical protein